MILSYSRLLTVTLLASATIMVQSGSAAAAPQGAVTLSAGDSAPELTIGDWVKGEPVRKFEKGKVYVIEFWATWCGPCIASMPHLSELQHKFREDGLTIIGITSPDPGNTLELVRKMVEEKGEGMGYTVAWDPDRKTSEDWMRAAGQNGIPTSFLVDKEGRIAYIGHPIFLDLPLERVLKGTWDIEAGNREIGEIQQKLSGIYQTAGENPADALQLVDEFESSYPIFSDLLGDLKFQILLQAGKFEMAWEVGRELVSRAVDQRDPSILNSIAWTIVDPESDLSKRDLDLAFKAASRAVEFTNNEDPFILDTLARVYFLKKDYKKAVEIQTRAVELLGDNPQAESFRAALQEYKKAAGGVI